MQRYFEELTCKPKPAYFPILLTLLAAAAFDARAVVVNQGSFEALPRFGGARLFAPSNKASLERYTMQKLIFIVLLVASSVFTEPCHAASSYTMTHLQIDTLSLDTPTVRLDADLTVGVESGNDAAVFDLSFTSDALGRMIVDERSLTETLTPYSKMFDVDLGPNYIGAHWPTDVNSFRYLQLVMTIHNAINTDPSLKPTLAIYGVGFDLLNASREIDSSDSQYFVPEEQNELSLSFDNPPLMSDESTDWRRGILPQDKNAIFSLLVKLDDLSNFSRDGISFNLRSRFSTVAPTAVPLPGAFWLMAIGLPWLTRRERTG